jgi:hypothetical protein
MSRAQVHCRGCNRVFTTRGLTQHLSRSHSPKCRAAYATIQSPIAFQTRAASNLASNPVSTSWDHDDEPNGNGPGLEHGRTAIFDKGDVLRPCRCTRDLLTRGFQLLLIPPHTLPTHQRLQGPPTTKMPLGPPNNLKTPLGQQTMKTPPGSQTKTPLGPPTTTTPPISLPPWMQIFSKL